MEEEELSFKGDDPGAVRYGNFINYYEFHDPHHRINNFNCEDFPDICGDNVICLDIGCNTGELTKVLYNFVQSQYTSKKVCILGIDLDSILIQRAIEKNDQENISFLEANLMNPLERSKITNFLKMFSKPRFDFIFCFSVFMWIHLNYGDHGLLESTNFVIENSNAAIIEIQPWKCYKSAVRRLKRSSASLPLYETIQIKENIENYMENLFKNQNFKKFYETESPSWKRKILCFKRN